MNIDAKNGGTSYKRRPSQSSSSLGKYHQILGSSGWEQYSSACTPSFPREDSIHNLIHSDRIAQRYDRLVHLLLILLGRTQVSCIVPSLDTAYCCGAGSW